MQSKNWLFTLNNYDEDDIQKLRDLYPQDVSYLVFGRETAPSTGTPHLQGFFQCNQRKRLGGIRNWLPTAHLEIARGSAQENRTYCTKDGEFEEFGEIQEKGRRNDLRSFMAAVVEGNTSIKRLREDYPDVCAKYPRFVHDYIQDHRAIPELEDHPLRDWQASLNDTLAKTPSDREITFVVDETGNSGKTWFAKHYCRLHDNAQYMEMGKKADMAHALNPDIRVLFVNCTRQQLEYLNYSFLEAVKDGMVFSPKYESGMKILGKVHVCVMMNKEPDYDQLSADRYNIIKLN